MRSVSARCLAFLLSLALLPALFTGCAKKDSARDTDAKSASSLKSGIDGIEIPGGYADLNGDTIRISSWFNLEPTAQTAYYEKYLKRKKALEEKFNCKIKYVEIPADELYETVKTSAASADPVADIIRLRSPWVTPVMAGEGLLLPVDTYFDLNDSMWDKVSTRESIYKGRPYGVNSEPPVSWACVWYNKTLVKEAKLKDPAGLISSGTWTWDKWVDYSKAISKLGTKDVRIYGTNIPYPLAFVASNGGRAVKSINNRDVWALNAPEAIDSLKFLRNVANSDYAGGTPDNFAGGRSGFLFAFSWEADFINRLTDKWGLLPYPIGPSAGDFTAYSDELQLMTLPKAGKHPKEAARIWTELSRPYTGVDMDRAAYSKTLGTDKDIKTALMLQTKLSLDRYRGYKDIQNLIFADGNSIGDIVADKTARPIEEWVNEISPAAEDAISRIWTKYK